jgi:mono/diheme cytochrome c family protein
MSIRIPLSFAGTLGAAFALTAAISCSAVLPPAKEPPATAASATPTKTAGGVTFVGDVAPVLKQHCAACHTTGGIGASKVTMFNEAGEAQYSAIKARIGDMLEQINDGKMPLGKPNSVPAADVKKLEAWKTAGAPNNAPAAGESPKPASPSTTPSKSPSPSPSAVVSASPSPTVSASPAYGYGTKPTGATVSFATDVVPVLKQHCINCHNLGHPTLKMFDANGFAQYDVIKGDIAEIISTIEVGTMPPGKAGSVTAAELTVLKNWQANGTPDN